MTKKLSYTIIDLLLAAYRLMTGPGGIPMTIKEIAQIAGVSISTVSKIVNNKDENINPETRNRVLKIVKEYNYSPYSMVKNSPETKTFIL